MLKLSVTHPYLELFDNLDIDIKQSGINWKALRKYNVRSLPANTCASF